MFTVTDGSPANARVNDALPKFEHQVAATELARVPFEIVVHVLVHGSANAAPVMRRPGSKEDKGGEKNEPPGAGACP